MPWLQNPDTGESYWSEGPAPAPAPIATGALGQANSSGSGGMTPMGMTASEAAEQARLNGQKAVPDGMGGWKFIPLSGPELAENQRLANETPMAPPPVLPGLPSRPTAPAAPLTPSQTVSRYGANLPAFEGALGFTGARQNTTNQAATAPGLMAPAPPPRPVPALEQGPAEVDRARIDALLGNVSKATSGIMGIGQRDLEFSAAQAQLRQGLEQGQRQALSLARSGSRRDRAGNEARAIQSGTELAAQTGQAAAGLRANEEAAQQQIRLDAYKAAGDLGLNAGALDLNAQSLDMNAATNFLNQTFQRENIQLNLDQQEAERVTNFVRDMALLSRDYYALGQQERDAVRQDLTRRYGISETSRVALEQLEAQGEVNWEQMGANMLAGAVIGGTQVAAAYAGKPPG